MYLERGITKVYVSLAWLKIVVVVATTKKTNERKNEEGVKGNGRRWDGREEVLIWDNFVIVVYAYSTKLIFL